MTNLPEWERQLARELAEIRAGGEELQTRAAEIRGRAEHRGLAIEVDLNGDITNIHIPPTAMQWPSTQLSKTLLECHRRARTDAANKARTLLRDTDPRLRHNIEQLTTPAPPPPPAAMTEEQIQAADDAYYHHKNNNSGWTK